VIFNVQGLRRRIEVDRQEPEKGRGKRGRKGAHTIHKIA